MFEIYLQFIPLILLFATGIVFKKLKIADLKTADLFLKIIFYIGLPGITIYAMHGQYLDSSNLWLTMATAPVNLLCGLAAYIYLKFKQIPDAKAGVLICGAMIINNGFMIPVISGLIGPKGLYYLFLMDVSNGVIIFSLVYLIACRYGSGSTKLKEQLKKFVLSPPLISLLLILSVNALQINLPKTFLSYCKSCGELTVPLLLISLGIYFRIDLSMVKEVVPGIILRSLVGLVIGLTIITIFKMPLLAKTIVILCSAAPVGYNTLTFAVMEDLDRQTAANMVSLSIFAAFIYMPILYYIVR
jgi:predicted permease